MNIATYMYRMYVHTHIYIYEDHIYEDYMNTLQSEGVSNMIISISQIVLCDFVVKRVLLLC